MEAVVQVGEAIPVSPTRDRSKDEDPVMAALEESLNGMIESLSAGRA